ncbi:MAG: T9SS type A sorting domain-containing protein [Algibacter sp.]
MKKNYTNFLLAIILFATTSFSYGQNMASYTSPAAGYLDGVAFTISGHEALDAKTNQRSMTGENQSPILVWNTPVFSYDFTDSSIVTVTFESPISNLRMYLTEWSKTTVTFNHPYNKLAGWALTAASSTELVTIATGVAGTILFTEDVTTLTITTNTNSSRDAYTTFTGDAAPLGLNDVSSKVNKLKVFPNPSTDFIQVSGLISTEEYSIIDVLGAKVGSGTVSANTGIAVNNLVKGIYFLKLDRGNTFKFVKK